MGISGSVFTLLEVVVQLVHTAGTGFAILDLVRLETALIGVVLLLVRRHGRVGLADLMVDLHCHLLLHGVGDMEVFDKI